MVRLLICFFTVLFSSKMLHAVKLICNGKPVNEPIKYFDVNFYLFKSNKDYSNKFPSSNLKAFLAKHHFNFDKNTAIIVHGFTDRHDNEWIIKMSNSLKKKDPSMNVILVDWSSAFYMNLLEGEWTKWLQPFIYLSVYSPDYIKAALGTELVANELTRLLIEMGQENKKVGEWKHIHLIGHSLGAHVVGQTARYVNESKQGSIHRITALDPAYPCFEKSSAKLRIKKNDASFIDVIHTNCQEGDNDNLGIYDRIGDIDFYPNGGDNQPNCNTSRAETGRTINVIQDNLISYLNSFIKPIAKYDGTNLLTNMIKRGRYWMLCNHLEATEIFTKSLEGEKFLALKTKLPIRENKKLICSNKKCNKKTCIEMGINAEKYKKKTNHGVYYVVLGKTMKC